VADLGPAGTVADLGGNTQKLAMGIATQPGSAGATIANAMKARAADSTNRVPAAVNDVLGPVAEPTQIKADIKANKETVGPQYDAAINNANRVHVASLASKLDAQIPSLKCPALTAAQTVRNMLNVNGANAADIGNNRERPRRAG